MASTKTKKELQQQIMQQIFEGKTYRYSLTKKQGGSIFGSLAKKDVILMICPQDNKLFYLRQDHKLPLASESNIVKAQIKDVAEISRIKVFNQSGSDELTVKYIKKDEKGKQEQLQWIFNFVNKDIANQWYSMLMQQKKQINSKLQPNINTNNQPSNNMNQKPVPYNPPKPVNPSSTGGNQPLNPNNKSQIKRTNSQMANKEEINPSDLLITDSRFILTDPEKQNNQGNNPNNPYNRPPSNVNNSTVPNNLPAETNNPKPSSLDESRISLAYMATSKILGPESSKIKPENQSSVNNDWNFKFAKNPTRQTCVQFEKTAMRAFDQFFKDSKMIPEDEQLFVQDFEGLLIQIADNFTISSKRLKNQYRNYHYILECCKSQLIFHVPLTCLIQHQGSVCLVKAKLANKENTKVKDKRDLEQFLNDFQLKTNISNSILYNSSCTMHDLTKIYGSYGQSSRIYIDDLYSYLPQLSKSSQKDRDPLQNFCLRPLLIPYFKNRTLPGGNFQMNQQKNPKIAAQIFNAIQHQIMDIAELLSSQQIYIINIFDLKQFLHFRGLNMKFLYRIYAECKNKFVKKYLLTCLVAKLIKDQINSGLTIVAKNNQIPLEEYVQEQIRYFIEGKTATTNQYWKRVSIRFRNLYGTPFNSYQLIGGFFLSCLMTLIPGVYNLKQLDKDKVIFRDQGIIGKGFITKLKPKIKSYYKFDAKIVQTAQVCKYSEQTQGIFNKLVQYMKLKTNNVSEQYNVNESKPYILGYLSQFVPAQGMTKQTLPCASQIYSLVNYEPPNAATVQITLNFLTQYLNVLNSNKQKADQKCQTLIRESIQNINYWLQFEHPKICQFYEKASKYEQLCGNTQESLKILEKAIDVSYKTEAKNTSKLGIRHFVAGCQYLKAGKKKQAIDNLQKAKSCMQKSTGQQNEYALVLVKLSSLYLNSGDTQTCIKLGKQALKNAQKGRMTDNQTIKICQILCRGYQIKGQKQQLRKLSHMCAKDFNKTQHKYAFSQMLKICLTSSMARLTIQRSKSLLKWSQKLKQQNQIKSQAESLAQLMDRANSTIVMQNFMSKADNVQKYFGEYTAKKQMSVDGAQFTQILILLVGAVGFDFVEGLHMQKQFQ